MSVLLFALIFLFEGGRLECAHFSPLFTLKAYWLCPNAPVPKVENCNTLAFHTWQDYTCWHDSDIKRYPLRRGSKGVVEMLLKRSHQ